MSDGNPNPPVSSDANATSAHPSPVDRIKAQALEAQVLEVLRTCYDPEIPVNIYELGLVYKVDIDPGGSVVIEMTLTSPMCPVAGAILAEVESKVRAIDGVAGASVVLVWDPPWSPDRMSEAARLQLNL
ncbi:MAG: metal-sulfur cluster assembly factor [Phycisphaerae bacterium]